MSETVPSIIETYLAAAQANDIDGMVATFTEGARVVDESRTHVGRDGIRKWREGVASAYQFTSEIRESTPDGPGRFLVKAHLEGNFPGGVVDLAYRFTLSDGLIEELQIAP